MEERITLSDFTLSDGEKISRYANENKGVILVFTPYIEGYTTRIITKNLGHLHHKFKSIGFEIVLVFSDTQVRIEEFLKANNINLRYTIDDMGDIAAEFQVKGEEGFSAQLQPLRRAVVIGSNLQVLLKTNSFGPGNVVKSLYETLYAIDDVDQFLSFQDVEYVNN